MPVYERAYQHWDGEPTPVGSRFTVIAGEAFRAAIRSKWVWALLTLTVLHVGIRAVILYVTGQVAPGASGEFPQGIQDQVNFTGQFLADAINQQARWVLMLMLALVAAPSLSRDLQAGALQFYFSKPITRTGYAIGKLLPPVALGMSVTVVPGLVLWVVGMAFTPTSLQPDGVWLMPLTITLAGFLVSLVASLIVVALSGLVRSTMLAAATWVGLALLTAAASAILYGVTSRDGTLLVDIFNATGRAVEYLLGASGSDAPTGGAWFVTVALGAAAVAGLWYILRDPEVGA